MASYAHPVHLLNKKAGNPLKVIACGRRAHHPRQYTTDHTKASCHDCAREAEGLTPQQRTDIWDNANERMGKERKNPWAAALAAEAEQKAKAVG